MDNYCDAIHYQSTDKRLFLILVQLVEVRVLKGFLHWNTTGRIQHDHLHQQVQAHAIQVFEIVLDVDSFESWKSSLHVG